MMLRVTALWLLWAALSCVIPPIPQDPSDEPVTPTGPHCSSVIPECCAAACANLERLSCPGREGSPGPDDVFGTPDDVSCTRTCAGVSAEADLGVDLNLDCVAVAETCAAAEACQDVDQ
jgi:hypothetical protein